MRALAVVLLTAGILVTGGPAHADCAAPEGDLREQLGSVDAAFVGTVVATPGDERIAHVVVEAVWHGDVAEAVEVRGSPLAGDPNAATSLDRTYRSGERYLFAVSGGGQAFTESSCSPTRVWDPDLNRHRPEGVQVVAGPPAERTTVPFPEAEAGGWWPWLAGAGVLAGAALGGAVLRARSHRH